MLPTDLLPPLLHRLLTMSLEASLLALFIAAAVLISRHRIPPKWRYALWCLVLAKLLLPVSFSSSLSLYNLLPAPGSAQVSLPAITPMTEFPAPLPSAARAPKPGPSGPDPALDLDPSSTALTPFTSSSPSAAAPFPYLTILYLTGALTLTLLVVTQSLRLSLAIRAQRPMTDQTTLDLLEDAKQQMRVRTHLPLIETDRVATPSLFGFIRPKLLLPARSYERLLRDQLRHVLLHELAHLKRLDVPINCLATLLLILHWFNPLIWIVLARMRAERELACDALVLDLLHREPDAPHAYGQTLLELLAEPARTRPLANLACVLENPHQLKHRIAMIASFRRATWLGTTAAALLLLLVAAVGLTQPRPKIEPKSPHPKPNATRHHTPLHVLSVDLGDLAWGQNTLKVTVENTTDQPQPFWLHIGGRYLDATHPRGFGMGMQAPFTLPPHAKQTVEHPYWIPPQLGNLAGTVRCVWSPDSAAKPSDLTPFYVQSFSTTYSTPNTRCNDLTPPAFVLQTDWAAPYRDGLKIPPFKVVPTEHFVYYILPGSPADADLPALQADREQALQEISSFLDREPPGPINVFLYPNPIAKRLLTMHQGDGLAFDLTIVEVYNDQTHLDPRHELTHILAGVRGRPPALLSEGLAVYMQRGHLWHDQPVDDLARQLAQQHRLQPLASLLDRQEIGSQPDDGDVAYPQSASFVSFLIDRFGRDTFLKLYSRLQNGSPDNLTAFEQVLNLSLDQAQTQWLAHLSLPPDAIVSTNPTPAQSPPTTPPLSPGMAMPGSPDSSAPPTAQPVSNAITLDLSACRIEPDHDAPNKFCAIVAIHNASQTPLPEMEVAFYQFQPDGSFRKYSAGTHHAGPIDPGQTWREATLPLDLHEGLASFLIFVDPQNLCSDPDRSDNAVLLTATVNNHRITSQQASPVSSPDLAKLLLTDSPTTQPTPHATGHVYVMGNLKRPGAYGLPADGDLHLRQLLAAAGCNPEADSDPWIHLYRVHDHDTRKQIVAAPYSQAIVPPNNPVLKTGDLIFVTPAALPSPSAMMFYGQIPSQESAIYLQGDVPRPGSYDLPSDQPLNLLSLLTAAGFDASAHPDHHVLLVRRLASNSEQTLNFLIHDLLSGATPDIPLQPSDMVLVQSSPTINFTPAITKLPAAEPATQPASPPTPQDRIGGPDAPVDMPPYVAAWIVSEHLKFLQTAQQQSLDVNTHIVGVDDQFIRTSGGLLTYVNHSDQAVDGLIPLGNFGSDRPDFILVDETGQPQTYEVRENPSAFIGRYSVWWSAPQPILPGATRILGYISRQPTPLRPADDQTYALTLQNFYGNPVLENFFLVLPDNLQISKASIDPTSVNKVEGLNIYLWQLAVPANTSHRVDLLLQRRPKNDEPAATEPATSLSRPDPQQLRQPFDERIKLDRQRYSPQQLREIERLYQVANKNWRSPEAVQSLETLVARYPDANRTGCALLYLGQMSEGPTKERYLLRAMHDFPDCYYGDGVQVGPYAMIHLAHYYLDLGRTDDARSLLDKIRHDHPTAIDHRGRLLIDHLPDIPAPADTSSAAPSTPHRYDVNRPVTDFPDDDFSTPESAYAAINRVSAAGKTAEWARVSTPSLASRFTGPDQTTPPQWADVLRHAQILEVNLRGDRAIVLALLPQQYSSNPIRNPIDARWLQQVDGRWLNTGNDRFDTIQQAREKFQRLTQP